MHYNPVAQKYKIILHTKHLSIEDFNTFFSSIVPLKKYEVKFLNPYTGKTDTAQCYRGDRKSTVKWDLKDKGILLNPTDISLIEL